MKGYWNNSAATAETLVAGWLKTGDLAYFDADGYCHIVDRAKDMLIRGGENIFSVEVENALLEHLDVVEAAVVGIPPSAFRGGAGRRRCLPGAKRWRVGDGVEGLRRAHASPRSRCR